MNFALDIIWLAPSESGDKNDLRVVYIKKMHYQSHIQRLLLLIKMQSMFWRFCLVFPKRII